MVPEELFTNLELLKKAPDSKLNEFLKSAIKCTFVEKFVVGSERPCDNDDFIFQRKPHEVHISFLYLIIEDLVKTGFFCKEDSNPHLDKDILSLILIICGENVYHKPWNTEKTVHNTQLILAEVFKLFNCCDLSSLIKKQYGNKLFKEVLQIIRPKLLAKSWKHYPAAVVCYTWILKMIEQPDLSYHLPSILPTALFLVDDFMNENRILGIQCLSHIVNNLTLAELQFHNHGDVIYNALLPMVRIREPELLNELLPCLVVLTDKLETDLSNKNLSEWNRFDDIFEIFLENMEMETLVANRNCYVKNLLLLLKAANVQVMRWTKRLLRIFKEYVEIGGNHDDDVTINYCLKSIEKFIKNTKSGQHLYAKPLSFILLTALYNSCTKSSKLQNENQDISINCIKLLNYFSESEKKEIDLALSKNKIENLKFRSIVTELFKVE